jgi:hypothetical protein
MHTSLFLIHPKPHFDTNLCIVIGSWDISSFLLPILKVLSWVNEGIVSGFPLFYHYMMQQNLLKFAQWWLGVLSAGGLVRRGLTCCIWLQLVQNQQKNDQQWFFCLFCTISQKFVLRHNNTHFDVMGHNYTPYWFSKWAENGPGSPESSLPS